MHRLMIMLFVESPLPETSIMCLVKRNKHTKPSNVASSMPSSIIDKPQGDLLRAWSTRTSNRVNQHDSSSSLELTAPGAAFTPNHSKESQVSTTSSAGSRSSLPALKEVVGDGAIVFQYKELSRATDNFSRLKKIGNSVYKGTLRSGLDVAISIHKKGEMHTDLVPKLKTLCSVHHSNVVPMIGACTTETGDYVYAVYPLLNAAKLRDCLRSVHSPGYCVLNTWTKRVQVAVDVAKGLEYLHDNAHEVPLVHKYVKSNNILLNSETLRAEIAQFGIADLAGEVPPAPQLHSRNSSSYIASSSEITEVMDEPASPSVVKPRLSRSRSRKLTGTRGYMAPEYMKSGVVTSKLDVFAFGMVLLELLSGQEAISYRPDGTNTLKRFTLSEAIRTIMDDKDPKARLRQWIDPLLKDSYPLHIALKVAELAKSCVESNPAQRPEMRTVALDLSKNLLTSEKWEASMMASKAMISQTMEAR